jgi:hypothetical protein
MLNNTACFAIQLDERAVTATEPRIVRGVKSTSLRGCHVAARV